MEDVVECTIDIHGRYVDVLLLGFRSADEVVKLDKVSLCSPSAAVSVLPTIQFHAQFIDHSGKSKTSQRLG